MDKLTPPSEAILAALENASRSQVDAYLAEQAKLARLQAEELSDQRRLNHWRSRVEHWSGVLKLSFEVVVALLALLVVVGVASAVWNAAHDRALVIEAFSVPPDLAARGLDGEALAAQLQDRLSVMQAATQSLRTPDSYSNDWGNDIKVQIPETGVSIGELHRLLVSWLGHQTHISGEAWHTAGGIAITTRVGGDGAVTVRGSDKDLEALLERSAEAIYRRTQPYRYAVYLQYGSRPDWPRIRAIFNAQLMDPSPRERAWAHIGLSNIDSNEGNIARSLAELAKAAAVQPRFSLPWQNMMGEETSIGHEEDGLAHAAVALRLFPDDPEIAPALRATQVHLTRGEMELVRNDYASALREYGKAAAPPISARTAELIRQRQLIAMAFLHDGPGVRAALKSWPPTNEPAVEANRGAITLLAHYALGDWPFLAASRARIESELLKSADAAGISAGGVKSALNRQVWPYFAVALAMNGDVAEAERVIARTPLDCDVCLRARGLIAGQGRRWGAADYWFARAVASAPSIALGYSQWGGVLLAKGNADAAIAKFAAAHTKSPNFADPLELWGEALIAKQRSDLALEKFAAAAAVAPNWGRLHLKWGEALHWLGREAEAKKEFALAAKLDLTAAERTMLARLR